MDIVTSPVRGPIVYHNKTGFVISPSLAHDDTVFNSSSNSTSFNITFDNPGASTIERGENPWRFEFSVIMATILSISAFLTIVGNAMVLTVIYRHRGMRTRTNLFLVNLAIADFLVGVMVVPFSITTLIEGRWMFGEEVCTLNGWVNGVCLITSIHTLTYIGINKYFSICRPLSNPIQLKHIIMMMFAAWLWGAICASLTTGGLNSISYKVGTSQCGPEYPKESKGYIYHTLVQVTVIVIPFCILLFCYIQMFYEIQRHSERLRNNTTVEEVYLLNQQKRIAVTLFIVLATFIIMFLPYNMYSTYTTVEQKKENISNYINPIAYCFLYLNSMCNPIIYAFRSPAFREGYKEILCQTPNYVIRDDSNDMRCQRFNSIVPGGRSGPAVRVSSTNTNSENNDPRSPAPLLPPPAGKPKRPKLRKQPTMTELMRSSQRTTTPLVIHRDGEVVVMKSGKIVSVRRESDSSISSSKLNRISPRSKSVANALISPFAIDPLIAHQEEQDEGDIEMNSLSPSRMENGDVIGFTTTIKDNYSHVFVEASGSKSTSDLDKCSVTESLLLRNGAGGLSNGNGSATHDATELSREFSYHSIEELSASKSEHSNRERLSDRRNVPNLLIEIHHPHPSEGATSSSLQHSPLEHSTKNHSNNLRLPALSNMVSHVASATTDVLLGMPLTPFTRNVLTKSAQQLNSDASYFSSSQTFLCHHQLPAIVHSRSSDNLHRAPFTRYSSLEHLDRHKPLFESIKSHRKNDRTTAV